jgi:fumarate hydratase class II
VAVLKEEIGEMRRVFRARLETDPLGDVSVPAFELYGAQTQRALDNFRVSNLRIHPVLITAYAEIKQAAAEASRATGALKPELANASGQPGALSDICRGRRRAGGLA